MGHNIVLKEGQIVVFNDFRRSKLKVHDLLGELPKFMFDADLIFVDPPYNERALGMFYSVASIAHTNSFQEFYKRLFECIREISPATCYVEVGKEYLAEFLTEMKQQYPYVTFYNSTYYHKKGNICYVIRGGQKRVKLPLDGVDEEDIIKYVCKNEKYECIADLCMGQGLVAVNAAKNERRFVGTELNPKRLSVAVKRVADEGIEYQIEE